jgi:energy-coupling factor transporter ATP-binding protein EcfA2
MIIIKSIEIYNFRSIVKLEKNLTPNDLNIIVGQNDIGKSNFLKALNLFFNGETELKTPFRFSDDFSRQGVTARKKAPEVRIRIEFETPERFKKSEKLVWTKVWRTEGLYSDEIKTITGRPPSMRGGAYQWIKKIKYKYVPAIRGTEYFNHLMGDLHDALSEINPTAFQEATSKFIDGLKTQVEKLVSDISSELGYTSQIGTPTDFKQLFSTLDFSLEKGGSMISLNKRGDGIKAQHIPVILKFISAHYKSVTGRAIINPDTVWGFEEPENNMEMGNAFKLAKIFASFSRDIQIFINTHSPAFYSLAKDHTDQTSLYLARSGETSDGTQLTVVDASNIPLLDKEVGILPIISDYIKKEVELRQEAELRAAELSKLKSNTKYLVLSEDEDLTLVKTLFEMQGFDMEITEFISYYSRSNLMAAIQASKVKLTDKPDLTDIIYHRDSDIYENDESDRERVDGSIKKINESGTIKHHLFKTSGYDLEAYFINIQHIKALYSSLTENEIEQAIAEATEEAKEKSIDKLYHKLYLKQKEAELSKPGYTFNFC